MDLCCSKESDNFCQLDYDLTSMKFYLICESLSKSKNENEFVVNLTNFMETIDAQLFKKINNVKKIILDLKSDNFLFAYKIALFCYAKSELSSQFVKLLNLKSTCNLSFIINKKSQLKNDELYMNSHKLIQPLNKITTTQILQQPESAKVVNSTNQKDDFDFRPDKFSLWYYETRIDIINRLTCLRNYFGLEMLQNFKIKNVSYDEIIDLDFKKLAKYYNKIILKIKKEIHTLIEMCEAFIDIEKLFATTQTTPTTTQTQTTSNIQNSENVTNNVITIVDKNDLNDINIINVDTCSMCEINKNFDFHLDDMNDTDDGNDNLNLSSDTLSDSSFDSECVAVCDYEEKKKIEEIQEFSKFLN